MQAWQQQRNSFAVKGQRRVKNERHKRYERDGEKRKGSGEMAKKEKTVFVCQECGYESTQWMGKCICGAWNSFVEEKVLPMPEDDVRRRTGGAGGSGQGAARPARLSGNRDAGLRAGRYRHRGTEPGAGRRLGARLTGTDFGRAGASANPRSSCRPRPISRAAAVRCSMSPVRNRRSRSNCGPIGYAVRFRRRFMCSRRQTWRTWSLPARTANLIF